MDSKEGVSAGVTWIGAKAPSNYHVAVRTENPNQVVALGSPIAISPPTAVAIGAAATMERKRRGRPRKYGPSVGIAVPTVISQPTAVAVGGLQQWRGKEEADPETMDQVGPLQRPCRQPRHQPHHCPGAESSVAKQGGGQPIGLENNQLYNVGLRYAGDYCDLVPCSAEACLIPHLINIEKGEDITMKIISFHEQCARALCILSAIGLTSNVKLRQPGSSDGIFTFEGIFQILMLTGSFTHTQVGSSKGSRSGVLNVTLAGSDGHLIGGMLSGRLIAAGPVKVVVGSFMPNGLSSGLPNDLSNGLQQQKRKKKKRLPKSTPIAISSTSMFPNSVGNEHYRTAKQNNSAAPMPNLDAPLIRTANRESMGSTPDSQKATTYINSSLHGA
ncbi:AT-hook motif nuclear-localized protein 7-like [Actinidia eriantha]|uniref:AT-hook motif nuclear-localized protein 7-like n=1 Tax=Actinidia eriantha TaxID=165200 RepID=UPI00258312EF|nr:AT-hook motif nuclear-localized protein 7-like [Actinidia eriantha]XP_057500203.1 AT-hook motif nuclear-localized protein 7-like [Actinidia eriantha]